ncbi:MAG: ribonuclease Z, partial [Actinomycetota bacterium]|nr:ribonuclease Z [Actinomycetota bacterium]
MELILTGTGSPLPDANRAGPSTLVKAGDTHIL